MRIILLIFSYHKLRNYSVSMYKKQAKESRSIIKYAKIIILEINVFSLPSFFSLQLLNTNNIRRNLSILNQIAY